MFLKLVRLFLLLFLSNNILAQNAIVINPEDDSLAIIRKASSVKPSGRQLKWQQYEITAFFHFGVNTFTDREWGDGKEDPAIFDPAELNTDQWVREAKAAGAKLVIITVKHHDGFCLWQTKTTDHSVRKSPWRNGKGDVVQELATSCKKYGVRLGIYLSPWDMNSPLYGSDAYNDFFVQQLAELLTNYGRVDEVWFDGANGEGPNGKKQEYDFARWYKLIRRLQPQAVIAIMGPDVRWVGTETGYGRETEWSVVPVDNLHQDAIAKNSQQSLAFQPGGDMRGDDLGSRSRIIKAKGLVWYPAETDVSIRPGWFYHEKEKPKPVQKLMDIYFNSVGKNGVLLINIPPDKRGLIAAADVDTLRKWKAGLDEIFKTNMIINARNKKELALLLDGKLSTAMTSNIYEINFLTAQKANVLMLQENIAKGQQVEQFILEFWDGSSWRSAATGTTIGYKRLLQFPEVKASKFRLKILMSRAKPQIAAMGLYFNKNT